MARKTRLVKAAVQIGSAIGRAERVARDLGESAQRARKELVALKKVVRELSREAGRAKKRLKRALR